MREIRYSAGPHDELPQSARQPAGGPVLSKLMMTDQASESLFRLVFEAAPNALVMAGQDGRILMANTQAEDMFGCSRAELLGQPVECLIPARFAGHHSQLRDNFYDDPRPRPMGPGRDLFGRRKDGTEFPIEIGLNPVLTEDGPAVLASILDITERKQSELTLRESEHRLRSLAAIIESSDDAIISNDLTGTVMSWNPAAESIFGYAAQEMIGHSIFRLAAPGQESEMRIILNRIKNGDRVEHYQTLRRHKDGSLLNISLTVSPIYDAAGHLVGASKVARDVTLAVRSASALSASQARLQEVHNELMHVSRLSAMGEMASALAHELNQPLAAITNYMKGARRLLAASADPEARKLETALDKAAEQAMRAGQIIRRLREFVGRSESERREESIRTLIDESCALGLIGTKEYGIIPTIHIGPAADSVVADRVQVQQVFVNLIRNAAEAMADTPRRELTIAADRADESMVEITVSDTGNGFTPEILAQLFQPFFTTKQAGMGVGLSISKSIIEAHGGSMRAESNDAGGATFRVTLPAAMAEAS